MRWIKIIAGNLLVFGILFGALEVTARILAPDYSDAYFTADVTRGYPIYLNTRWGHRVGRDQVDNDFISNSAGEKRVLFGGDSVTFGYGLPYEQTYHQVAARILTRAGCKTQVMGLGRFHTNLPELLNSELGHFVWEGFHPQIFIYQFQANDVPLNQAPKKAAAELTWWDRFEKFRISYLNRSAFLKWIQSAASRRVHGWQNASLASSLEYAPDTDPASFKKSWEIFEKTILDIRNKFIERGIAFHILISPESYDISKTSIDNDLGIDTSGIKIWPSERVREIATRNGIPLFDPSPALQKYREVNPTKRLFFPNDPSHPNLIGHRLIGEAAAKYLRSLPELCQ